jgi:tRNA threonylcarbamoyladenosine biosynthesis protein TsaB
MILGIDSSSKTASAALADGDTLLAQMTVNNGLTHSHTLLPMIQSLLTAAGAGPRDLRGIAVTIGPGSFTGLRIGLATAQALAFPDLPCAGVSSLEAAAYGAVHMGGLILSVMDARRSQFYNAVFQSNGKTLTRIQPDCAAAIDDLFDSAEEPPVLTGDGAETVFQYRAERNRPVRITPPELRCVSGWSVCRCALPLFESGQTVPPEQLRPVYLRMPQAERERLARVLIS